MKLQRFLQQAFYTAVLSIGALVVTRPAFAQNASVFLGASPSTAGSIAAFPAPTNGSYPIGTVVCLIPYPAPGYIFKNWSSTGATVNTNNCGHGGTVSVTISGNAVITANFEPTPSYTRLLFVPVRPCRIADTRNPNGPFGGPRLNANETRNFTIPASACNIPSTAAAYSINLTVVPAGFLGYVTLWPTGQTQPYVSTLNSYDGRVKSNAAIVPAGAGGAVSVFATNATHVILDIDGYFDSPSNPSGLAFYPLTPCRIADTRNAASGFFGGPFLGRGETRSFPVLSSPCNVPVGAQAYSMNFTVVPKGFLGYLTVWPDGQSQPYVSTLNSYTGVVTANAAIVPAGNGGAIDVFVTDATDLVIDINGYFAPPGPGGLSLYNLTPCRVVDTRAADGSPFAGTLMVSGTGVACGVPNTAEALVLNATVQPSGVLGYLTLWPDGGAQPYVSTLNSMDGGLMSNMALVPAANGWIDAYAATTNSTHLILDISGFFAP